jgi:ligand-binding SRPBCC domain-containing protein
MVEYEPGRHFVDVLTSGPCRFWRRDHVFEDQEGQTVMRDRMQRELPFGVLDRVAHSVVERESW